MKTRITAFLLAAVMALGLLAGCQKPSETVSIPVHIEGAVFGGQSDDSIASEIRFNPDWMTRSDNTKYQKELASFAALLCADTYFRQKDLDRGTQNRVLPDEMGDDTYSVNTILNRLGFVTSNYIESYKAKTYASDTNDSVTLTIGNRTTDDHDLFVFAIRGCFSAQEWLSVFDPGFDSDAYRAYTGEHPEWLDASRFKGADIAARRAMEFINEFIEEHDNPEKENCILITGHSRGGIIANIIGAEFEKNARDKTFTYTFNATPVTTDETAKQYRTIFNLYDQNDFYTQVLSFGKETFYRYGKDLPVTIAASDAIKNEIAELKGRNDYTCVDTDLLTAYRAMFGQRFADRASLYDTVMTLEKSFASEEEANARREELLMLIGSESGLGLEIFCQVGDAAAAEDGTFSVSLSYCGGALLWGYCKILAYGEAAHTAFLTLFDGDADSCEIADFLSEHAAGITGGHLLANSYVLTRFAD